jgi:predicted RNA-binding Zn ribbon-like protein
MDATEFRLDCGATWLNLLATSGQHFGAHPIERVPDVARLAGWLAAVELTPREPPTADDVDAFHVVRETLRPLALAVASGEAPAAGDVTRLREVLAAAGREPVTLAVGERLTRDAPADTPAALARITRQAVDHLTGPERASLAICPEHDCRGVFATNDPRRRWCPSPQCASRGRVRALRERRRQTPNLNASDAGASRRG